MGIYGYLGVLCVYMWEAFLGKFYKKGLSKDIIKHVMGVVGLHQLKSMEIAFMDDMRAEDITLEELQEFFFGFVEQEMKNLYHTIYLGASHSKESNASEPKF